MAAERKSKTYCIVISARGPNEREMQAVKTLVPQIKEQYDLEICACLGLLTAEQAQRLKACGVDKVNHNVNTSPEHYADICTTHTYDDRLATLRACREAGMALCSGGIIGMGERDTTWSAWRSSCGGSAWNRSRLNFLIPIAGTPLSGNRS